MRLKYHPKVFFSKDFKIIKEMYDSTSQDSIFEIKLEYEYTMMRTFED